MEQAIPCHLPSFPSTKIGRRKSECLKLELSDSHQAQLKSAEHQQSLDGLLQAAWALVLRCFMGVDVVCFGRQVDTNNSGDVAYYRISDNDLVRELAHRHSGLLKAEKLPQQECQLFNTIYYLDGENTALTSEVNVDDSLPEKESWVHKLQSIDYSWLTVL
jgi:hypothetical protein